MKLRLAKASQLSWSWGLAWLSLAIKANIEKRKARGYGIKNNILAIVNKIPLSFRKIQAGLLLRQAMLVNGILFNSKAGHSAARMSWSLKRWTSGPGSAQRSDRRTFKNSSRSIVFRD